jgi:hypothetical protein
VGPTPIPHARVGMGGHGMPRQGPARDGVGAGDGVGTGDGVYDMQPLDDMRVIYELDETDRHFARLRRQRAHVEGMGHRAYGMLGRERRIIVHNDVATLNGASNSNASDYESQEQEDANTVVEDFNGMRHLYRDETWLQKHFTYSPKPMDFIGRRGTTQYFHHVPSPLHLFQLFWTDVMLNKIIDETNRYATQPLDALGNTMGGKNWVNLTVPKLKAFLATHMYMGMKRKLNIQSYWEKEGSIFHCPIISSIMSRD